MNNPLPNHSPSENGAVATAGGIPGSRGRASLWAAVIAVLAVIVWFFCIETRYGHLSKIKVDVGQRVSRGDRIGDMGNTGRSTGTHLHYEIRIGDRAIDPMTFIRAAKNVF